MTTNCKRGIHHSYFSKRPSRFSPIPAIAPTCNALPQTKKVGYTQPLFGLNRADVQYADSFVHVQKLKQIHYQENTWQSKTLPSKLLGQSLEEGKILLFISSQYRVRCNLKSNTSNIRKQRRMCLCFKQVRDS